MSLSDLPQTKWGAAGQQAILKGDFDKIEDAIVEAFDLRRPPSLSWVDAGSVKVLASTDTPARVMLNGFPNVWNPGQFIDGGLCDGKYRVVTSDVTLALASTLWGAEKASQWYAVLAIAGDADAAFTLKAMPWLRVQGEAAQVISCGLNATPATDCDYGFTNDEFVDSVIYVISGAKKGQLRTITANNVASSTSTITYTGTALSLSQGDWFIILPATNFKFLGSVFNDSSGNLKEFTQAGDKFFWASGETALTHVGTDIRSACPLAAEFLASASWSPGSLAVVTISGVVVAHAIIETVTVGGDLSVTYTYDLVADRRWVPVANCVFSQSGGSSAIFESYGFAYPAGILG